MNGAKNPVWRRGVKFVQDRRPHLAVLPTLLTLGNGTCGLAAVAMAVSDTLLWPEEQKLMVAGLLIFSGMVFDAFDGQVARLTRQSSEFGAQLDSLCDAITFGVAPAIIVWRYSEVLPHRAAWTVGVLYALCVLLRLARFNAETKEDDPHDSFEGLPSPAAAGTIASLAIAVPHLSGWLDTKYSPLFQTWAAFLVRSTHYLMPLLAVALAYLMVSRLRYPHGFQSLLRERRSSHQIGQAIFIVMGVILLHELVLPLGFCYFVFSPPLKYLFNIREKNRSSDRDSRPDTSEANKSEHEERTRSESIKRTFDN